MKYSVFTVVMKEFEIEEVVSKLVELGFNGVEWRVHDKVHINVERIEDDAKKIKKICDSYKLEIPVICTYLDISQKDKLKHVFNGASMMGCPAVRVIAKENYDRKQNYRDLFYRAKKELCEIEKIGMEFNIKALIEIHMNTIASNTCEAYNLVSDYNPDYIGIIFDPANIGIEVFVDWKKQIDMMGNYLAHVHVKNILWYRNEEDNKFYWKLAPLDTGMIDWKEVIRALTNNGYNGYLSLEDLSDIPDKTVTQKLEEGLKFLKSIDT